MPNALLTFIAVAVALAFLAGTYGERWRAQWAGRRRVAQRWRSRRAMRRVDGAVIARPKRSAMTPPAGTPLDAADQLRLVMGAPFAPRRLMSKSEARVFYAAEAAIRDQGLRWRAMAQVNLGEVLSSPDARAFGAINSKRVDVLLVSSSGDPMAAIEFQGEGHYQGSAPARDAVKKEALRKAGVGYIEMTPQHAPEDLHREIARIAAAAGRTGRAAVGRPALPHPDRGV